MVTTSAEKLLLFGVKWALIMATRRKLMSKKVKSKTKSTRKLTGAFDLLSPSAEAFKRNWKAFLLLSLPGILLGVPSTLNGSSQTSYTSTDQLPINVNLALGIAGLVFVGAIIAIIVGSLIMAALTGLEVEAAKGKQPSGSELWEYAKKYWLRLLGLQILVGLTIFVGFLLLIVPGLIFLRRYYLSSYYLIDQDLSISEAMKRSADQSKPFSGYVWSIIGVAFLFSLTAIVPIAGWITSTILGLLYSVAPALRYFEIKKAS